MCFAKSVGQANPKSSSRLKESFWIDLAFCVGVVGGRKSEVESILELI
jgi:hypothetical protein